MHRYMLLHLKPEWMPATNADGIRSQFVSVWSIDSGATGTMITERLQLPDCDIQGPDAMQVAAMTLQLSHCCARA